MASADRYGIGINGKSEISLRHQIYPRCHSAGRAGPGGPGLAVSFHPALPGSALAVFPLLVSLFNRDFAPHHGLPQPSFPRRSPGHSSGHHPAGDVDRDLRLPAGVAANWACGHFSARVVDCGGVGVGGVVAAAEGAEFVEAVRGSAE